MEALPQDKELEEIAEFFDKILIVKEKVLRDIKNNEIKKELSLQDLVKLFNNNINLINVISEDTLKIYIQSTFDKSSSHEDIYIFSESSLETFLTSILIFCEN